MSATEPGGGSAGPARVGAGGERAAGEVGGGGSAAAGEVGDGGSAAVGGGGSAAVGKAGGGSAGDGGRRPGTLRGVGVGPGDPELVTVKAARLIGAADVVAYYSARHGRSIARSIAEPYFRDGQLTEPLVYPVTTETTDHPGGYEAAITEFYDASAERLAAHLSAGRDVVVICAGDPMFYGSYMYLHERLAHRFPAEVVPGVTSISAATAVLGRPLVERDEVLTVLPGTLPADELTRRLADTDAAAVLKLGRTFPQVRAAFADAGRLADAWYVERATTATGRELPLVEVDPDGVPYFSLAVLTSPTGDAVAAGVGVAASTAPTAATEGGAAAEGGVTAGGVTVVGLGPAGSGWLTPETGQALREAEHLVGYGPYVDRVPHRPGQHRHTSGNQVEIDRARHALELALAGARVTVVSSGDPGIFAMATAVLEVATTDGRFGAVPVRVLPGLTAAQAAASRIGAPLGHDFAVLSLSDRLKPWTVIEQRLAGAAAADLVLALYNPASASRRWQVEAAQKVLLRHRSADTPVVIARDVGRPGERITVVPLAELDPSDVDMRCLLIVGSSTTRTDRRADGSTVVWTPRTYPG
ncbi:precorrin-2 C(20)-methyltransferase [Plantactinospora sp. KLBMP9567]|uniref:precorrin-2 C(20)-methyltransferase n=1 Tax=Plantactinospora sp. KLBMP9567 TaxID=3085900 RepID=UPI0029815A35|nr:precorrin-2 C(20)-methyltransferase [Plantactinospora sp. KLBMP9567]MDW5324800.1 precorrin-2 C(20)-methyltransferase [Plantactinospora sp. KLBMP9567]MDW5330589.1 precorrin-2 C(20)-methyltransferase [Plantactinospora sp. KLBMP9567]